MMLSVNATDSEILDFVEKWVGDLVREDYVSAYNRTNHDPYYEWTPELIEKVINGYGLPESHRSGEIFKVTAISEVNGENPWCDVDREHCENNRLGYVYYNLPLNGEWSDLTASFRLERQGKNLIVVLQEIHVF